MMDYINIKKLALAVGLTAALLYLGCLTVMMVAGHDGTVIFFNSILHGLDTSSIIRMNVPLGEAVIGIIEIFIIGWLTGACIAMIYNTSTKRKV